MGPAKDCKSIFLRSKSVKEKQVAEEGEMASRISSAITQCTNPKKMDEVEIITDIDDQESSTGEEKQMAPVKGDDVQGGFLWRMSSGAVGGVYNVATGAAGMGYNTTKWVIGKSAEIGTSAVVKTKDVSGSVIGKTAEVGASIVHKIPIPGMGKAKDKKE